MRVHQGEYHRQQHERHIVRTWLVNLPWLRPRTSKTTRRVGRMSRDEKHAEALYKAVHSGCDVSGVSAVCPLVFARRPQRKVPQKKTRNASQPFRESTEFHELQNRWYKWSAQKRQTVRGLHRRLLIEVDVFVVAIVCSGLSEKVGVLAALLHASASPDFMVLCSLYAAKRERRETAFMACCASTFQTCCHLEWWRFIHGWHVVFPFLVLPLSTSGPRARVCVRILFLTLAARVLMRSWFMAFLDLSVEPVPEGWSLRSRSTLGMQNSTWSRVRTFCWLQRHRPKHPWTTRVEGGGHSLSGCAGRPVFFVSVSTCVGCL